MTEALQAPLVKPEQIPSIEAAEQICRDHFLKGEIDHEFYKTGVSPLGTAFRVNAEIVLAVVPPNKSLVGNFSVLLIVQNELTGRPVAVGRYRGNTTPWGEAGVRLSEPHMYRNPRHLRYELKFGD